MKVNVQVSNTGEAIEGLREYGVKAMAHKTLSNEIVVDSEDKKKVVKWMTGPGGFDLEDIKKMYSELLESNLSLDETIRLINVNESHGPDWQKLFDLAWNEADENFQDVIDDLDGDYDVSDKFKKTAVFIYDKEMDSAYKRLMGQLKRLNK